MRELMRRAMHVLRRRQFDADLAEEMAFHRDMAAHELERRGASGDDATNGARRAFGSAALAADQARDVWVPAWLRDIAFDVKFAVRRLATDGIRTVGCSALPRTRRWIRTRCTNSSPWGAIPWLVVLA